MFHYKQEDSKASAWMFSSPKGNTYMYTFTYLYNFHILHNTVFQRT